MRNPSLFERLDKDCIYLVDRSYWKIEVYEGKGPTNPFLLNWRSKYYQKDASSKFNICKICLFK